MRALLVAALLLATPLAAAARFVELDPLVASAPLPCGDALCIVLDPAEASVRIAQGAYSFRDIAGRELAAGVASPAPVLVPDGAILLVVRL